MTTSFDRLDFKTSRVTTDIGEMWCTEFVDGLGKVREEFPKFYSRHALWAKAHALSYYATELYDIKTLTTPLD